ncbi:MAG: hypothetical protein EPO02_13060 [Nitrospirae bacterium]|nr:MAG: hypothetical protein EPO02_13060 [Nitrospirota bacterium]
MSSSASCDRDPLAVVIAIERDAQVTESDLALAGELQRSLIFDRTARGVDADGAPFAPYAESYAKKRAKSGRQTSVVDLLWSGRMLQAVRVVTRAALGEVALVVYGDEAVRAGAHNDSVPGRLPRRGWFAANDSDVDRIARLLERLVGKRVNS